MLLKLMIDMFEIGVMLYIYYVFEKIERHIKIVELKNDELVDLFERTEMTHNINLLETHDKVTEYIDELSEKNELLFKSQKFIIKRQTELDSQIIKLKSEIQNITKLNNEKHEVIRNDMTVNMSNLFNCLIEEVKHVD
jgi:cell division protein FtsB